MRIVDVCFCCWIDCLGRQVKICSLAIDEVKIMIQYHLEELDPNNDKLTTDMNMMVLNTINQCQNKPNVTCAITLDEIKYLEEKFIYYSDEENLLPIPVLSTISPENPIHFLIHIMLFLGKYDTELTTLTHPSFRDCLCEVHLIGKNNYEESLKKYVKNLTKLYIESQVVYYPNSIKKTETYIVMANGIFEDVILHNSIPIFELPPYSMNSLRDTKTVENIHFWESLILSQLQSARSALKHMENIPSVEEIINVSREKPLKWSPLTTSINFGIKQENLT